MRLLQTRSVGLCFVLGLTLLGCGDNQDDEGARQLLARVRAERYRDWARAPGYETRRPSRAAHGDFVDIYVNEVIAQVLASEKQTLWPTGSVIVKDGFEGSEQQLTAVMEKRSDGWYWAEFDETGTPNYSGHPNVCIDCHRSGSDFVRAFPLP
jgi:hypothetical protein